MMVNGVARDVSAPCTVASLVQALGIEIRGVAVAVNGDIVLRSEWSNTVVNSTDHVEIVTAAAGG